MPTIELTEQERSAVRHCLLNYRIFYDKQIKTCEPESGDNDIIRQNWLAMLKTRDAMDTAIVKLEAKL